MASIFCSATRRQNIENKKAAVSAVLATLRSDSQFATPEEYSAFFTEHYNGDKSKLPKRRLGEMLRKLNESKRKDDFVRKLEKKNSSLERKLSVTTTSSAAASTKSGGSSTTLVDSSDDEKEGKKSMDSEDGAPLELTCT
jgi:hypothetical protein